MYDGQIEEDVHYLVTTLSRKIAVRDLKYNKRRFPNNDVMHNDIGVPSQGLLADSRYYNFAIARKILFFITFFSRYLIKLYSYTRNKAFQRKELRGSYKFWRKYQ